MLTSLSTKNNKIRIQKQSCSSFWAASLIDTIIFAPVIFLLFFFWSTIFPENCTSKGLYVPNSCEIGRIMTILSTLSTLLLGVPSIVFLIFFKANKTLGERVMNVYRSENDYIPLKNLGMFYFNLILISIFIFIVLFLINLF